MKAQNIADLIWFKAVRLVRHRAIRPLYSVKDIEQELWLHYLKVRHRHDSDRSSTITFFDHVLNNRCRNMLAAALAQKREGTWSRIYLWEDANKPSESGDPVQVEEVFSQSKYFDQPRDDKADHWKLSVDRIRLKRALRELPQDMQTLAEHLSYVTPTEASRMMGISHSKVYRGIKKIRDALLDRGIDGWGEWVSKRYGRLSRRERERPDRLSPKPVRDNGKGNRNK